LNKKEITFDQAFGERHDNGNIIPLNHVHEEVSYSDEGSPGKFDIPCGQSYNILKNKENRLDLSKRHVSLNKKQIEAACNEDSIPLMIVARSGSGKVLDPFERLNAKSFLYSTFYCFHVILIFFIPCIEDFYLGWSHADTAQ
jgi:hypothetical protein